MFAQPYVATFLGPDGTTRTAQYQLEDDGIGFSFVLPFAGDFDRSGRDVIVRVLRSKPTQHRSAMGPHQHMGGLETIPGPPT